MQSAVKSAAPRRSRGVSIILLDGLRQAVKADALKVVDEDEYPAANLRSN